MFTNIVSPREYTGFFGVFNLKKKKIFIFQAVYNSLRLRRAFDREGCAPKSQFSGDMVPPRLQWFPLLLTQ